MRKLNDYWTNNPLNGNRMPFHLQYFNMSSYRSILVHILKSHFFIIYHLSFNQKGQVKLTQLSQTVKIQLVAKPVM